MFEKEIIHYQASKVRASDVEYGPARIRKQGYPETAPMARVLSQCNSCGSARTSISSEHHVHPVVVILPRWRGWEQREVGVGDYSIGSVHSRLQCVQRRIVHSSVGEVTVIQRVAGSAMQRHNVGRIGGNRNVAARFLSRWMSRDQLQVAAPSLSQRLPTTEKS